MADEINSKDQNYRRTVSGITSSSGEVAILRLDDTTKRLLVAATTDGADATADGDAVNATTTGYLMLGTDGSNYQVLATDASGNLQVDVVGGLSGLATSAKQLADGHNVTIDNISTNEVFIRGSQAAGSPVDNEVVTVQGITSMTPLAVTESSPISGFATSAKQLADGHTVVVETEDLDLGGGTITAEIRGMRLAGFAGTTPLADNSAYGDDMTVGILPVGIRLWDSSNADYDRAPGDVTNGMLVNLGSNNNIEPDGTALGNAQVSVDTTAGGTTILAASAGRAGAVLTNHGTTSIFIGTGAVTTSNGFELKGGESVPMPTDSEIKGIVASTTVTVSYLSFA